MREAGILIPQRHQRMLINILELENVTVNDIMVPRNEVTAIDLDKSIDDIIELISHCQHTRLPVYKSNIENIIGIIHIIPQQWLRQLGVLIYCNGEARPRFWTISRQI